MNYFCAEWNLRERRAMPAYENQNENFFLDGGRKTEDGGRAAEAASVMLICQIHSQLKILTENLTENALQFVAFGELFI